MSDTDGPKKSHGAVVNREVYYGGDIIIHQGDEGYRAYYIERGKVAVFVKDGGHDLKITELGPGDLFGEMALINDEPRSATVKALEETSVCAISRDEIESKVKGIKDKAMRALVRILANRLRDTTKGQMEHFRNTSTFLERITEMVDRMSEDMEGARREKFRADITPLLENLGKVLERYQK